VDECKTLVRILAVTLSTTVLRRMRGLAWSSTLSQRRELKMKARFGVDELQFTFKH
jgi:hypothetical protein